MLLSSSIHPQIYCLVVKSSISILCLWLEDAWSPIFVASSPFHTRIFMDFPHIFPGFSECSWIFPRFSYRFLVDSNGCFFRKSPDALGRSKVASLGQRKAFGIVWPQPREMGQHWNMGVDGVVCSCWCGVHMVSRMLKNNDLTWSKIV